MIAAMGFRGILSRVAQASAPGEYRPPVDEVESIIEHLRAILNARRGQAVAASDYGMVDFADLLHSFPQAVQVLQRSIRETVLAYEPRLKNVRVRHLPDSDELLVKFEITAQLSREGARRLVRFRTQANPSGSFEVW